MIPKTLEAAAQLMLENIDPGELKKTRVLTQVMDLDEMVGNAHHSIGREIRNIFELWDVASADLKRDIWEHTRPERKKLYDEWWDELGDEVYQGENMHADDACHELMYAVLEKIKNTPG